jgi:hypothetical protein
MARWKTIPIAIVILFVAFGGLLFAQTQQPQQPPPGRGGAAGGMDPRMEQQMEHQIDMMFRDMDTNHDGRISKSEWMNYYEKIFKRIDTNGAGFITKDEVRADMMRGMRTPPPQQRSAPPAQ